MNFLLLFSCLFGFCLSAAGMQEALSDQVVLVRQAVQRKQEPVLEKLIQSYLILNPIPQKMPLGDFLRVRKICIDSMYGPLLSVLLKGVHGKRIVDPKSTCYDSYRTYSLLGEAVFRRAYANVQILLEAGADPDDTVCDYEDCKSTNPQLLLNVAISHDDADMVKLLLDNGASQSAGIKAGMLRSPLMRAVQKYAHHTEDHEDTTQTYTIIRYLLQKGALPDEDTGDCFISCYRHTIEKDNFKRYRTPRELAGANHLKEIVALFDSRP